MNQFDTIMNQDGKNADIAIMKCSFNDTNLYFNHEECHLIKQFDLFHSNFWLNWWWICMFGVTY